MKKALLFVALTSFILTAFIYKPEMFYSGTSITAQWSSLADLPYTISHHVSVATDTASNKILIMGGIVNDTISGKVLLYNAGANTYDTLPGIPNIPKRLMSGFGFRLSDSVYFGGGYAPNWKDTTLSSADTLYDCAYTTADTGYVAGQRGKIFYTSSKGVSWIKRSLPDTTKNVIGLSFINSSKGWAAANNGDTMGVYVTTNSGASWTGRYGRDMNKINSIFYVNSSNGWIAGDNGKIKKNNDSLNTWTSQSFGSVSWKSIYFLNINTGYISGSGGNIIKTTNGGNTWISQTTNTTNSLNSITFYDALTGYAVGDTGRIIKTTNGGTTWTTQISNVILNLRSVEKKNASQVIAAGDGGVILYTTDGGAEWINRVGVSNNRLNSVCMAPGDSIPTAVGVNSWLTRGYKPFFEYLINNTFYRINLKNLTAGWISKTSTPISIAEVSSSSYVVDNKTAFVAGGRSAGFNYVDSVMSYNPFTNLWSFSKKLPKKLSETGAALVDAHTVMIVGGRDKDSINSKIYLGTLTENAGGFSVTWAARPVDFPIGVYALGSKGLPKKHLGIFVGGNTSRMGFLDAAADLSRDIFIYNSATDGLTRLTPDVANPICHTGVEAFQSVVPFLNSAPSDTAVRLFAPGGRDENNLAKKLHKVLKINGLVGINQIGVEIPEKFFLSQNYPNPFNPQTKIIYDLPEGDHVEFSIFDALGKEILSYSRSYQPAGKYEIEFNGSSLSTGVYFYRLKAGEHSGIRKMLLIK